MFLKITEANKYDKKIIFRSKEVKNGQLLTIFSVDAWENVNNV
jgi:hypothetical protein